MKIKFLGTGSGQTSLNRSHSSILISSSKFNLLVDCGDGISRAFLNQKIDFQSIDFILISHFHADHFTGLPALLTQMKLVSKKTNLTIFVHISEKNFLEQFLFHSYLFKERMTFEVKIISFETESEIKMDNSFFFIARRNSHLDKYKQYDPDKRLGFVSLSFFFRDDENSVIYTGDIASEKDLYLFDQKVEWFISESTHIEPQYFADILTKLNPDKLILTHISDENKGSLLSFQQNMSKSLKSRIFFASDGFDLKHCDTGCL